MSFNNRTYKNSSAEAVQIVAWLEVLEQDVVARGLALKEAKEAIAARIEEASEEFQSRLNALATVRTKKGLTELVESFAKHAEELVDAQEEQQGGALESLTSLADQIDQLLTERAANTLALGKALSEAKALFDKGADFIAWAEQHCGIKRAQVFKWLKVWDRFGDNALFEGVAMRVLYTLASLPEDSPVYLEATELLELGKSLDSRTLTGLIQKHEAPKPEPKADPSPVIEPELVESQGADPVDAPEMDAGAPWEGEEVEAGAMGYGEHKSPETAPESAPEAPKTEPVSASELTRRDRLIEELQATIAELNEQLKRAQAPAAPAQLPPLPQFDQACPFAVLGLSRDAEGDAAAIKKAHRALAKLYSGQPEVSEKLMNARKALLAN